MTAISRDSRKVADFLGSLCLQHNEEYNMNTEEIYSLESAMLILYVPPVVNLLKTRIKSVRKFSAKHGTMAYWIPVVMNMLGNSTSAKRQDVGTILSSNVAPMIYQHIVTNYLLCDYSHEDLVSLMKITNTYSYDEVVFACGVGKSNSVYEPRYISAVLEKERAKKGIVIARMDQLAQMADQSNGLLGGEVHIHTPLELAEVEYRWRKAQQDALLEQKMNDMLREMGK